MVPTSGLSLRLACLSVALGCFGGGMASASSPDPFAAYNTLLGTHTIQPTYSFTDEGLLVETAKRIREMGSNLIKLSLNDDKYADMDGLSNNLTELVQTGQFKQVLDMDFSHYHFWAYSEARNGWNNGDYTQAEQLTDYQSFYDLTQYFLTTYSGSGKRFYLGNWEGDWHLLKGEGPQSNPSQQLIDQMIEWYNVRQRDLPPVLVPVVTLTTG
ncbi:hypothetical protein [Mucisphaera sp.]|uniref:hypothetical protein n=1 Tax=Mucisphaera sp. TaxID=2913024 RepID=UPI003D0C5C51